MIDLELIARIIREGKRQNTTEGVVYSLEEGIDENTRYHHVTMPRREGGSVWYSESGRMFGIWRKAECDPLIAIHKSRKA